MFTRITKVKGGDQTYEYLQIVEAYRENGRPKQRVVANLGRVDRLGDRIDDLVASLGKHCQQPLVVPEAIRCRESLPWPIFYSVQPVSNARLLRDKDLRKKSAAWWIYVVPRFDGG